MKSQVMFRVWDNKSQQWFTSGRVSIWMRRAFASRACPPGNFLDVSGDIATVRKRYTVWPVLVEPLTEDNAEAEPDGCLNPAQEKS